MNQDRSLIDPELGMVLLADGMSGRPAGDHAAELAIATMHTRLAPWMIGEKRAELEQITEHVRAAYRAANEAVMRLGQSGPSSRMATTLSCAVFAAEHVVIANVGDSRVYRLRHAFLKQVTVDHRVATPELAALHVDEQTVIRPLIQLLTKAVGESGGGDADLYIEPIHHGDVFMLCTNGITDVLPVDQIAAVIVHANAFDEACGAITEAALAAGSEDDATVVLVCPQGVTHAAGG